MLFPVLHCKRNLFIKYIGPVSAIAIYGYFFCTSGCINHPGTWLGLCYKGLLRGYADLAVGAFTYEISRKMDGITDKRSEIMLNIAEVVCLFSVVAFAIFHGQSDACDFFIIPLISVLVAISFSSKSIGSRIFKGKIWNFLGLFSLSVYLNHFFVKQNLVRLFPLENKGTSYILISLVLAILNFIIGTALKNSRSKTKAYLILAASFVVLCFGVARTDNALPLLNFKGSGTIDNPYRISSELDMLKFREMVNNEYSFDGEYLRQTNDIDLSSEENWTPIGIMPDGPLFRGNYDGDGYSISNVTMNHFGEDVGFFGKLAGTVENVVMTDCNVVGNCVGGIASHGENGPAIYNCIVTGSLHGDTRAGGIADNMMGTVVNSVSYAVLESPAIGGISGYDSNEIINCYSVYGYEGSVLDGSEISEITADLLNQYIDCLRDEPNGSLLNDWVYQDGLLTLTHKD